MQIYGPSQVHGAQPLNGPHATRPAQSAAPASASSTNDSLDISPAGDMAGRLAEVPDIRANRVNEIRDAILKGTYETQDKLNTALDRLLDEIG